MLLLVQSNCIATSHDDCCCVAAIKSGRTRSYEDFYDSGFECSLTDHIRLALTAVLSSDTDDFAAIKPSDIFRSWRRILHDTCITEIQLDLRLIFNLTIVKFHQRVFDMISYRLHCIKYRSAQFNARVFGCLGVVKSLFNRI